MKWKLQYLFKPTPNPLPITDLTSAAHRQLVPRSFAGDSEYTTHVFDSLPWITALDSSPDLLSSDPRDFADLSQISVPCRPRTKVSRSHRRRQRFSCRPPLVQLKRADLSCSSASLDTSTPNRNSRLDSNATPKPCFDPSLCQCLARARENDH